MGWMLFTKKLNNKTNGLIIAKLKSYIGANGKSHIFQSDNGTDNNVKIFLEN